MPTHYTMVRMHLSLDACDRNAARPNRVLAFTIAPNADLTVAGTYYHNSARRAKLRLRCMHECIRGRLEREEGKRRKKKGLEAMRGDHYRLRSLLSRTLNDYKSTTRVQHPTSTFILSLSLRPLSLCPPYQGMTASQP